MSVILHHFPQLLSFLLSYDETTSNNKINICKITIKPLLKQYYGNLHLQI